MHVFVTLFSIASRELVFTPFFALVRHDFLICGKVIWEAMYDRACLLFQINEAKKEVRRMYVRKRSVLKLLPRSVLNLLQPASFLNDCICRLGAWLFLMPSISHSCMILTVFKYLES